MRSKNRKKRENFSCHRRATVFMKVPYMLIFLLTILQMGFWDWEVKKFECSANTFEGQGSNQTSLVSEMFPLYYMDPQMKKDWSKMDRICLWLTCPCTMADRILLIQPTLVWALMFLAPDGREIPALTELITSREIAHTYTHTSQEKKTGRNSTRPKAKRTDAPGDGSGAPFQVCLSLGDFLWLQVVS